MSFKKDMEKFTSKAEEAANKIFRGTALDLFGKIILRTPVDTGRAKGNWGAGLNRPGNGSVSGTVATAKIGNSLFLTNNLPYIKVLEEGSSTQAPQGMVKVTVAEFQRTVRANARKNK